jgi:ribosomal protein S18 acetylase RimI-like enzyme
VACLIRALGPDDAAAYRELRVRALREHPDAFGRTPQEVPTVDVITEHFRQDVGSDQDLTLGAFEGEALLGVAACFRERAAKQRHIAIIFGVYVLPDRRRTGLGRQLVAEVIARARTWTGLECLWLDVTTVNTHARALYASLGFRGVAIKPRVLKVDGRYYDEELMVLDLTSSVT